MKIPLTWLKDYVKTDASAREIANSFTQLGLMLDKPLDNSGVLDLEHRMDRSDWLSILGCARDYAAFNQLKLTHPKTSTTKLKKVSPAELIEITVNSPHVRRFNTRLVKNVRVGESPAWLKERLEAYGIKSINNVVDITNFVMVEYGQPMHAQDTAKLKKREITLRPAKKGESLKTILGTNITLDQDTFVLSSGGVPTVIGGIVGGQETSVTNTTTELILDAGNYDQAVVRKTSRRLRIINETVSRYDKFLHPKLCEIALDRATYLLQELTGAVIYDNVDYYPAPPKPNHLTLNYSRLKLLSGLDLPLKQIKRLLTAIEYSIQKETPTSLTLAIPYFRTDVEVEDDIIADILRLSDYSRIPTTPLTNPVPPDITPPVLRFEEQLRDLLVAQGAHEHVTTSLVKQSDVAGEILLSNALSTDQNALRTSPLPKLQAIQTNYPKHQLTPPLLFEIGKVFAQTKKQGYTEQSVLCVLSPADIRPSLATLMHQLGLNYHLDNHNRLYCNHEVIGTLTPHSYTLNTEKLHKHYRPYTNVLSEFHHEIKRDISLLATNQLSYADLAEAIVLLNPTYRFTCKAATPLGNQRNYLLTLTWPANSTSVETDITHLLNTLKTKLKITSKS